MLAPPVSPAPAAPPIKKFRAGSTPGGGDNIASRVEDAQERRRAELQRLKMAQSSAGSTALLNKARSQLQAGRQQPPLNAAGPPPMNMNPANFSTVQRSAAAGASAGDGAKSAPAVPPRPARQGMGIAPRHSDIFPTVEKGARLDDSKDTRAPLPGPPPGNAAAAPALPSTAAAVPPKPEPVARRLDESFASNTSKATSDAQRAKSAPPARPRPPPSGPPPPRMAAEAPEKRSYVARPPPQAPPGAKQPHRPPPPSSSTAAKPPPATGKQGPPAPPSAPAGPKPPATAKSSLPPEKTASAPDEKKLPDPEKVVDKGTKPPPRVPPMPPVKEESLSPEKPPAPRPGQSAAGPPPPKPSTKEPEKTGSDETSKAVAIGGVPATISPAPPVSPEHRKTVAFPATEEKGPRPPSNAGRTPYQRAVPATPMARPPPSNLQKGPTSMTNARHTPFHGGTMDGLSQPATPDSVQTPLTAKNETTSTPGATPELRLQKELGQVEREKADALHQVKALEDELKSLKENENSLNLSTVFQMADAEGESAALRWLRSQVQGDGKQVGFLSPVANTLGSRGGPSPGFMSPTSMIPVRKRIPTPHPKRKEKDVAPDKALLVEAVKNVPWEWVSDIGTFTIRRPYGLASSERDLWFSAGQLNAKMYERSADATKCSTLEVVAKISADSSFFLVYGDANARHQNAKGSWDQFGDVEERDAPLGWVKYIDESTDEKEYSLDDVFASAIAVREHYCSMILLSVDAHRKAQSSASAASVKANSVKDSGSQTPEQPPRKVDTNDVCVGTEDLDFPIPKADSKGKGESKPAPPPPPPDDSPDVISSFISMLFSTLFWIIWTFFFRLPFKILSTTFFLAVGVVSLAVVWLYIVDDNGAASYGASMNSNFNMPGVE